MIRLPETTTTRDTTTILLLLNRNFLETKHMNATLATTNLETLECPTTGHNFLLGHVACYHQG